MRIKYFLPVLILLLSIGVGHAQTIDDVCGQGNSDDLNITTNIGTLSSCEVDFRLTTGSNYVLFMNQTGGTTSEVARNDTQGPKTSYNVTVDLSGLADGNWNMILAQNYTNTTPSNASIIGIGLDSTAPTVPAPGYTDPVLISDNQAFTEAASDTGFTDGVANCTVQILENGMVRATNVTMTDAGTDSFTLTRSAGSGLMKFKVSCSDYHGFSTTTSQYTYDTYDFGKRGKRIAQQQTQTQGQGPGIGSRIGEALRGIWNWLMGLR